MVKLEEVEDQELDQVQPGPIDDTAYDSADFTDTGRCSFIRAVTCAIMLGVLACGAAG